MERWLNMGMKFFTDSRFKEVAEGSEDGCLYLVMYVFLCMTADSRTGLLALCFDGRTVPLTNEDIARRMPFMSRSRVAEGLKVLEEAGYLERNEDGILRIARFHSIDGHATIGG